MSAQNSKGIQTLLDAEREAQKIVQQGMYPLSTIYPLYMITDSSQPENHSSGNKKAEEDAAKDAEEQVNAIKASGEKSGQKVIDDLLRVVTDVRPEVPDRVAAPPAA
ncbi:MAG: hypothetical protein Q9208_005002 [Pyrenodesmia sp. 3 TL-2023]